MELSEIEGVSNVEADVQTQLVKVTFDAPATEQIIIDTLAKINYPVGS
jgi:copper chaperone CopZ